MAMNVLRSNGQKNQLALGCLSCFRCPPPRVLIVCPFLRREVPYGQEASSLAFRVCLLSASATFLLLVWKLILPSHWYDRREHHRLHPRDDHHRCQLRPRHQLCCAQHCFRLFSRYSDLKEKLSPSGKEVVKIGNMRVKNRCLSGKSANRCVVPSRATVYVGILNQSRTESSQGLQSVCDQGRERGWTRKANDSKS